MHVNTRWHGRGKGRCRTLGAAVALGAVLVGLAADSVSRAQGPPLPGVITPVVADPAAPKLPAFPGAEGFGAASLGGRGGSVIKVTTLRPNGPGSLQQALAAKGPRTVVFEVSGVIEGNLLITEPRVTIAGQTAPGAGVTIRGRLASHVPLHDVAIRFLRVRPRIEDPGQSIDDCIQLPQIDRLILDHVSCSWSKDENIDIYFSNDVTVQWCTVEESYYTAERHNTGLISRGRNISILNNLFAHHGSRCPMVQNGPGDIRHNVLHNIRDCFTQYEEERVPDGINLVGNYFKPGNSGPMFPFMFTTKGKYYLSDNFISGVGPIEDPWGEAYKYPGLMYYRGKGSKLGRPVEAPPVTARPALQAYQVVLERAGCFPRDAVTTRTIEEVRTGGGAWGVTVPPDLMQGLTPEKPPADSDSDGMPDAWETARGFDPFKPDHNTQTRSGYTAIEVYLDELAQARIAGQRFFSDGAGPAVAAQRTGGASYIHPADAGDEALAAALAQRPDLTHLYLRNSHVTDTGLDALANLERLTVLDATGTEVTDAGLVHLLALPRLKALDLAGTKVTDAGVASLRAARSLRILNLPAGVSDEALAKLRAAMPWTSISR